MRPPLKDARFPFENSEIDHKWLVGSRSPNEHHIIHPNDVGHNFLQQHGMLRNTHVEFPHHHSDRQINFHQHQYLPQDLRDHYHSRNNFQFNGNSGERMIFPSDTPFSDEFKNNNNNIWPTKVPDLSKHERNKGTWKWIPDNNNNEENESPEARFHAFHSGPVIYDSQRPHTVRDRPYTFESTDVFSQQTTPPTGPGSTWPTAEALMTGEEISTTGKSDESERSHLDVKLLR